MTHLCPEPDPGCTLERKEWIQGVCWCFYACDGGGWYAVLCTH